MGLPIYKITIDDEFSDGEQLGVSNIAFTANPAIKVKGVAFSADEPKKHFFGDKLKYRITAPALIPMDIYRCDEYEEYYVQFTENEIDKIHSKFMKNFTNKQVFNLEHNNEDKVNAYVLEAWKVEDPENDKSFHQYGIKVPRGTIMITSQIGDKETYDNLVANEQHAYSVEGFLGLSLSEIINKQIQKEEKMNKQKMSMPAGQYTMGNQVYTVLEDGTFSVADVALEDKPKEEEVAETAMADAPKEEEVVEEVVEEVKEEMAEAPIDDVPAPVEDVPSDMYSKAEVDAKFDELYQMIAELKSEEITEEIKEEMPVQMSEQKPKIADALFGFSQAIKQIKK